MRGFRLGVLAPCEFPAASAERGFAESTFCTNGANRLTEPLPDNDGLFPQLFHVAIAPLRWEHGGRHLGTVVIV